MWTSMTRSMTVTVTRIIMRTVTVTNLVATRRMMMIVTTMARPCYRVVQPRSERRQITSLPITFDQRKALLLLQPIVHSTIIIRRMITKMSRMTKA